MVTLFLLVTVTLTTSHVSAAQPPASVVAYQNFSADTVKQNIDEITKELALKRPGFYIYTSQENFTKYIASVKLTIKDCLLTGIFFKNKVNHF